MLDWFLNWMSSGYSLKELSRRLDVPVEDLLEADVTYHQFTVPKKSGKPRCIAAPNAELKGLQRKILHRLLKKLKVHPQATGFRAGVSFVDNAMCHQAQEVVIKVDLIDFFSAIPTKRIYKYFRNIGWKRRPAKLLARLTTYRGRLPQGAPTSPKLSNVVNYLMDVNLSRVALEYGAVYTRYADDITFSTTDYGDLHELIGKILFRVRHAGYEPHLKRKLSVRRQHHRQVVTGLVVNEEINLPREKRRWLRSVEHRAKMKAKGGYLGPAPTLTDQQLEGWRALQKMIESSKEAT